MATRQSRPPTGDAVWSPDGTRIAFRSARHGDSAEIDDIYVMNADGTELEKLTRSTNDEYSVGAPAWSADGTTSQWWRPAGRKRTASASAYPAPCERT